MARETSLEREVRALTREGEQYVAAGMLDRAELVNEQLKLRGADPVALPKGEPREKRTSTQAATRRTSSAAGAKKRG